MKICLAPLPMSTFAHSELNSIGKNYLKSICATAFEAVLMFFVIGIYGALVAGIFDNIVGTGDIGWSLIVLVGMSILLIMGLLRTSSVSKAIFSAA